MNTEQRLGTVAVVRMGTSPKGHTYNRVGDSIPLLNGPTEFGWPVRPAHNSPRTPSGSAKLAT
jgi:hypothetical protein